MLRSSRSRFWPVSVIKTLHLRDYLHLMEDAFDNFRQLKKLLDERSNPVVIGFWDARRVLRPV